MTDKEFKSLKVGDVVWDASYGEPIRLVLTDADGERASAYYGKLWRPIYPEERFFLTQAEAWLYIADACNRLADYERPRVKKAQDTVASWEQKARSARAKAEALLSDGA
jgi:hypothetical protein